MSDMNCRKLKSSEAADVSFESAEKNLSGRSKELLLDFIRSMLCWLPEERKTAKELLDSAWLTEKSA